MTYDEALSLDLGERVVAEGWARGVVQEIKHVLNTTDGTRWLFFMIEVDEDLRSGFGAIRGPFRPHQIEASLLQRMAEAANGDQAGEDGGVASR